jgi:hypothetical protein
VKGKDMSAHKRALLTPDSNAMRRLDALAAQMHKEQMASIVRRPVEPLKIKAEPPQPNPTDGKIIELTAQLQEARKFARSLYQRNQELEAMLNAQRIQVIDAPDYDNLPEGDELELVGAELLAQFRR